MQVGNKPIHYKSWSSNEVRNVGHLMKLIRRIFYSLRIWRFFFIKTNFLTFQGVISAIKALWESNEENLHNITINYETFALYKILVGKKQKKTVEAQRKWIDPKPKKTLIGTQFTDHLSCAQRSQNWLSSSFDCWTFCPLETVTGSVITQELRERGEARTCRRICPLTNPK